MDDARELRANHDKKNPEDPKTMGRLIEDILASMAEGFLCLDRNLVIDCFNKAAEEMLGRKAEEVVGLHVTDEAFPELKGSIFEQKYIETLRTGQRTRFETYFGLDPYRNWYDVRVSPCETGILVAFQVTTDYHKTIDALKAGQARFRELFDNMASGVAIYEASSDGRTFYFRDINAAGAKITGRTKEGLIGRSLEDDFPNIEKMGLLEMLRRVWRTGQPETLPLVTYEDDRTPVTWVENYVFKIGSGEVIAIFKDFTAEKLAMDEVRSIARFPAEDPFPVMRVDGKGVLMYANEGARPLLESWQRLIGEHVPEHLWLKWQPAIESGQSAEVEIACGKQMFSLNIAPVVEEGYANIYGRDITEAINSARERERLQEQLRQAQRMESIGRLAGGIAHDLNNLLTPIMGYSQLALKSLSDEHPLHDDMAQIHQAGQRAQSLTKQLLAFGRKQLLEVSALDLSEEVRLFEPIFRRLIREDIEIRFDLADPLGSVKADPDQMHQILMNLAMNAQDAMPDGGRIDIETADVEFDELSARIHSDIQAGPYVSLVVSDTGVGMDRKTQANIFEPFFTTKPAGQGTGLGLATVYGIVLQHKGAIWVYSEPGRGAAFKIFLPRIEAPAELRSERQDGPPVEHGGETILVVEDEEIVRKLTCQILERHGYAVFSACNAEQAIKVASEFEEDIQLLVTDVVMPKVNGRELYNCLRKTRPSLAVLYMSGYTGNVIAHHGVLEDGMNFIEKPFCIRGLTDKVRSVLDVAGDE